MDIDAALYELRDVLADTGDMARAHELFDAIDTWLCRGGYRPEDWA